MLYALERMSPGHEKHSIQRKTVNPMILDLYFVCSLRLKTSPNIMYSELSSIYITYCMLARHVEILT